MARRANGLTDLQERFCREYLLDLNATAAYQRAGYRTTGAGARVNACRLLTNANISARIAKLQQQRAERVQVKADQVIRELMLVAFSDVRHHESDAQGRLVMAPGVDPVNGRAVSSIKRKVRTIPGEEGATEAEVEIKLWPKVEALRLLCQHLGLLIDKIAPTDPTGTKEYGGDVSPNERLAKLLHALASGSGTQPAAGTGSGTPGDDPGEPGPDEGG